MIEIPLGFDGETLLRARDALDREANPEVVRTWARLFKKGYIGDTPPAARTPEFGLRQIAVLLAAQARA